MAESKEFVLWFLENLPTFLLSDPINQFLGFAFLAVVIRLMKSIMNISS